MLAQTPQQYIFAVTMNENWKDIKGFEGLYQVSDLGRIKSLARTRKNKNESVSIVKEIIKKPTPNPRGYSIIQLHKKSERKYFSVHRLVAEAFVPKIKHKHYVNHKNCIKGDNRAANLEWCTHKENIAHSWANGLSYVHRGENHCHSKLTDKDVIKIKSMLESKKYMQKEIAEKYKVSRSVICNIANGKIWIHIV